MSKIDRLIAKHCPNGVEFRELWELTIWDKKFNGVEEYKQPKVASFKHISAKKLKELAVENGDIKLLSTGKFEGYTTTKLAKNYLNHGEVITLPTGGSANIKYYNGTFVDSGNLLCYSANPETLCLKYLYYYFLNINPAIESLFRGSGVKHPDMPSMLKLKISLPPLAVQEEIVKILDAFTSLEAELEAELEARIKQYNYYRDALLGFSDSQVKNHPLKHLLATYCPDGVEVKELQEVFTIKNGYTPSKANKDYWTNGTIPWFRMDDIRTNGRILNDSIQKITPDAVKGGRLFPANSIIVATSATIGEHALITVPYLANQRFTSLSIKPEFANLVDIKFMFYYCFILNDWCLNNSSTSSFSSVNMDGFRRFKIPLPPLAVQEEIVKILDKFDALVNSISDGLPAEIKARRQQYEYYRNKLLSFKEKLV